MNKSTDQVIRELNALDDAMHRNECYACSHEFIDVVGEFGTNILPEAVDKLRQLQKEHAELKDEVAKHGRKG